MTLRNGPQTSCFLTALAETWETLIPRRQNGLSLWNGDTFWKCKEHLAARQVQIRPGRWTHREMGSRWKQMTKTKERATFIVRALAFLKLSGSLSEKIATMTPGKFSRSPRSSSLTFFPWSLFPFSCQIGSLMAGGLPLLDWKIWLLCFGFLFLASKKN